MSENGKLGGYARIMKDKGSRRLLMVGGGVIVVALGWTLFGGSGGDEESSKVRTPPSINSTQGGSPLTEQYRRNLQIADQDRAADAARTGGSAMPTVVANPVGDALPKSLEGEDEPPVKAPEPPKRPEPQRPVPQRPVPQAPQQPQARPSAPQPTGPAFDPNLAAAMQRQMGDLMKSAAAVAPAETVWFYAERQDDKQPQGDGRGRAGYGYGSPDQAAAAQPAAPRPPSATRFQAPAAGTILYAHLVGRVSSDVPGPVIAEILQGPFAGARLLGSFQTSEQGVLVSFRTMTVAYEEAGERRNEVVPINAVAVDSRHLGTALATDIDRHLFEKIAFGFATSFLQGLGQAIGMSGSTTVIRSDGSSVTDNALLSSRDKLLVAGGEAARSTGQILQQEFGNRKTTITVEAGTPFGLLFLGTGN